MAAPQTAIQEGLFSPGSDLTESAAPVQVVIPRYFWASTTARKLQPALRRLIEVIEAAPTLDRAAFATWDDALSHLASVLSALGDDEGDAGDSEEEGVEAEDAKGKQVAPGTVTKLLGLGEQFGMLSRVKDADRSPTWLRVFPAGYAVATDPDPGAMFAALLVQMPFSEQFPHRQFAGLLGFIQACQDAGIPDVRVGHVARFMATKPKEGPWGREAAALKKFLDGDPDRAVTPTMWWKVMADGPAVQKAVAAAARDLVNANCSNESDVRRELGRLSPVLLPAAREAGIDKLCAAVTAPALSGDAVAVEEAVLDLLSERKVDSHLDYTQTALRYLVEVGLLAELPRTARGKAAARFAITDFGTEALATLPPPAKSYAAAVSALRATDTSPYVQHRVDRQRRFDEMFAHDRTAQGRSALAAQLDWASVQGQSMAHVYEYAVLRSTIALVDQVDGIDKAAGIRTKLNFDLSPLSHAQGGGSDGQITLANGRTLIVEVTGETGGNQIKQELEPIVRHLRQIAAPTDTLPPAGIFVAPAISVDLAAYLLVQALGSKSQNLPPAPFVLLTEGQLQRLVFDGRPINDLIERCLGLVHVAAATPSLDSAAKLLTGIEASVAEFLTSA